MYAICKIYNFIYYYDMLDDASVAGKATFLTVFDIFVEYACGVLGRYLKKRTN